MEEIGEKLKSSRVSRKGLGRKLFFVCTLTFHGKGKFSAAKYMLPLRIRICRRMSPRKLTGHIRSVDDQATIPFPGRFASAYCVCNNDPSSFYY